MFASHGESALQVEKIVQSALRNRTAKDLGQSGVVYRLQDRQLAKYRGCDFGYILCERVGAVMERVRGV